MNIVFILLSVFFVAAIGICCFYLKKKNTKLSRALFRQSCGAAISTVLYVLSIIKLPILISNIINSLYFVSIHWLLILFFHFAFVLTETSIKSNFATIFINIWTSLLIADTVSLLSNVFFHHCFMIYPMYDNSNFLAWKINYFWGFKIHLALCYMLVFLIMAIFAKKITLVNKFYRPKFMTILFLFLIITFVNVIFLATQLKIDFSNLFYCIFALTCIYFTMYSLPHRIKNTMLQLVCYNLNCGIFCFDTKHKCVYANQAGIKFFPSDSERKKQLEELLLENKELVIRNVDIERNSKKMTLSEEFQVIKDPNEIVSGYFIRLNDITNDLKEFTEEQYRYTHDSLTGLYNRETFYKKVAEKLRDEPTVQRYMVCTNIKNFKLVNDLFGSNFGDELLKLQAKILQGEDFPNAISARISGDRFAMLIKKSDFDKELALKIISKLQEFTEVVKYKLHVFIGIYEISDPYENVNSMYDKANLSIKNINEKYSISLAFYNSKNISNLIKQKNIIASFENALASNQFKMYLQPQVQTSDEKILGAEALVRWDKGEQGILYPNDFIQVLEDSGFLYKLDQFIWNEAAKTLERWKKIAPELYIAVNISPKDFYHLDLYRVFTNLVKKYDIAPQKLKLEITETVLMHDLPTHKNVLSKLQKFGFSIEMDDFGSGYSSLSMLKSINVDILKIDMDFLHNTEQPKRTKKILKAIIQMAKSLKMKVVMEGVEKREQVDFLKEQDCDVLQGYLYSKPLPIKNFEERWIAGE
ncbi:EAL domain-containing protein [Treponema pectinovorum]|uniref:EAL domain-containing protein n=1 Tax=Treponema pectinovorum TaxID=164 RepID=UPI003D8C7081